MGAWRYSIINLGTRWRWVVSFTKRSLYARGKSQRYPLDRRLHGLQSQSGRGGERKIHPPRRELNACRPTCTLVIVLTELSWVTLQLTIRHSFIQSVSPSVLASSPSVTLDQILAEVWQLRGWCHGPSFLTGGWVCLLYLTHYWSLLTLWSLLFSTLYWSLLVWVSMTLSLYLLRYPQLFNTFNFSHCVKSRVCFSQSGSGLRARHWCGRRGTCHITGLPRWAAELLRVFAYRAPSGLAPRLDLGRMWRQPGIRIQVCGFPNMFHSSRYFLLLWNPNVHHPTHTSRWTLR